MADERQATLQQILKGLRLQPVFSPALTQCFKELGERLTSMSMVFNDMMRANWAKMSETAARCQVVLERGPEIMTKMGWPPHQGLTLHAIGWIVHTYDQYGSAASERVDSYMLQLYSEDTLKGILKSWRTRRWLRTRIPILEQVIEAHLQGSFWLSVPSLLPQIEGIIAERYGHKGRIKESQLKNYLNTCLSSRNAFMLDRSAESFFVGMLQVGFNEWLEPPQSTLSRHSILHGHDTSYGTAANSLKTILLFDYLQWRLCRFVGTSKGKAYHLVGCPIIDLRSPNLVEFENELAAVEAGRKPCCVCRPGAGPLG